MEDSCTMIQEKKKMSITPFNGKTKQYIAIIYMLATTLFIVVREAIRSDVEELARANTVRITAVETELKGLKDGLVTNRLENREEHRNIVARLDDIAKEVKR